MIDYEIRKKISKHKDEDEEYEDRNRDEYCFCLFCDNRIEQPAITGGFCWKCYETNEA